jgi:L-threonylcarbamoyladenylate synthase
MFKKGEIWAYPTDTSFGLGVRADDKIGLENLAKLKSREKNMFFSLMVRDLDMLQEFAEIPAKLRREMYTFFTQTARTAILKPTSKLPQSKFWPNDKVAFRVCTIPEISREIDFPITATSANISGKSAIYSTDEIREIFGEQLQIFAGIEKLPKIEASEIWDFTVEPAVQIR